MKNETKSPNARSHALRLSKETVKNMTVRSGVRTGHGPTWSALGLDCLPPPPHIIMSYGCAKG